jgi:hypothetical protein
MTIISSDCLPTDQCEHSETTTPGCQPRASNQFANHERLARNWATKARAVFGDYATLHVRGVGDVQVYIEQYAIAERGELIIVFRHPMTGTLQVEGISPGSASNMSAANIGSHSCGDGVIDHGDGSFTVG